MEEHYSDNILYLRIILIVFGVFSVGTRFVISCSAGECFSPLRFFTVLTNSLILLWSILAIIWRRNDLYRFLTGSLKGACTTYIAIVWLVFMILIEPDYDPVGIDLATSIFNHYINPWLFMIDTFISEGKNIKYKWIWPVYWLVYPLLYLAQTQLLGFFTGFYPYFFVNYPELGAGPFFVWVGILTLIFYLFGLLVVFLIRRNHKMEENQD